MSYARDFGVLQLHAHPVDFPWWSSHLSKNRSLPTSRGPGNAVDWQAQQECKKIQGSITLTSGVTLHELRERFHDQPPHKWLLSKFLETWPSYVGKEMPWDKPGVIRQATEQFEMLVPPRNREEPIVCSPPFSATAGAFGSHPQVNVLLPPYASMVDYCHTLVSATMMPGSRFRFCSETMTFADQVAKMLHVLEDFTYVTVQNHLDFSSLDIPVSAFTEDVYHGTSPLNLPGILLRGLPLQPQDTGSTTWDESQSRVWGTYVGNDITAHRYPMDQEKGIPISQDGSPNFHCGAPFQGQGTQSDVAEEGKEPDPGLLSAP